jgi:uncharacterized membrane protein
MRRGTPGIDPAGRAASFTEAAMPKSTLAGHPLHPQLIVLPSGLLPFGFAMDLMHLATGRRSYRDAAFYGLAMGLAGGAAAGVAGAMDYLAIPSRTTVKRTANVHAALNVAVLAGTATNLVLRARGADTRSPLPLALSALAALGVMVSGWYGGELVYQHGARVRDVDPIGHVPDARPAGDDRIAAAAHAVDRAAPATGPESADALPSSARRMPAADPRGGASGA